MSIRHLRDRIGRERLRTQRRWPHNGSVSMHLVLGLLIVVMGVLFLVSNLHIFELRSPMRYFWAAAFLAIGFAMVVERRTERSWQWGIGWIVAGLWTFAYQRRWIDIGFWELFVPLLMLFGGAYLVRRALTEEREEERGAPRIIDGETLNASPPPPPRDRTIRGVGVLSGSELKPTSQSFERAELFALMGGVKLDLYDAQFAGDTATINVAACMGGIEIHVPSEWTVISNVMPLMGAFIDKRRPAPARSGDVPVGASATKTLHINGFVLMGGVEIKN